MLALILIGSSSTTGAATTTSWTLLPHYNAVPSGKETAEKDLAACEAKAEGHAQFAYNLRSKHCYVSDAAALAGAPSGHVTSGCDATKVTAGGCAAPAPAPPTPPPPPSPPPPPPSPPITWAVKGAPDTAKSHCGFSLLPAAAYNATLVYDATPAIGSYNHAVMLDWHDGNFLLTWKNSPRDEDTPGQRVLYAQSADGVRWTPTTTGADVGVLFPNMTSAARPAALFGAPTVVLHGSRYAAASPEQFCLWPPPAKSPVLMRKVGAGIPAPLGPLFWLADAIPDGFAEASAREGVVALPAMDAATRADMALLADAGRLPCDTAASTKCEACRGGCDYPLPPPPAARAGGIGGIGGIGGNGGGNSGNGAAAAAAAVVGSSGLGLGGGGEYTRYSVPNATDEVILHRTKEHRLAFTHRGAPGEPWSAPAASTGVVDADSNLNAGALPDGRVFLVTNACTKGRDPLVVSTSRDGWAWTGAVGAMSCTMLDGRCKPRFAGKSKDSGQAYPQAVAVTSPSSMAGLWIAATNNKEDVWVTRVDYDALP